MCKAKYYKRNLRNSNNFPPKPFNLRDSLTANA